MVAYNSPNFLEGMTIEVSVINISMKQSRRIMGINSKSLCGSLSARNMRSFWLITAID